MSTPSVGKRAGERSRKVTMKDIARMTGVAQSTVSRILSGRPDAISVTEKTRQRVLSTALAHGYRPNPHARGLRGARTMLLGVVVRDLTDPFFGVVVGVLSRAAKKHGYSLVLGDAQGAADEAIALAAVLEARHCDAMVVVGDFREQPRLLDDLKTEEVPVVAVWHGVQRFGFASVSVDNRAAIHRALDHLTGLGHEAIALAGHVSLQERERAFVEYFGGGVPSGYAQHADNTFEGGAAALERLQALEEPPSAILAATDVLAMGVLKGAAAQGISVPAELSVVGFDDLPFAAATVPALTTLHMPIAEMGAAAIDLAVGTLSNNTRTAKEQVFQAELVVRGSTAPPRD
jgi:DNA-binding LacI/PurR family transcriptional regulator